MEQPVLEIRQAEICYDGMPVVKNVSLRVKPGHILGIVGESGSGKSTLIRACMGLLRKGGRVTHGDILYRGISVPSASREELRRLCGPGMGMIFQDCKNAMCPIRTIGSQLVESVREHKKGVSRKEVEQRAAELLEKLGLKDAERILKSYPFELSGGMNQRVGIMTAMVMEPDLLFADEPTSALDVTVQAQVIDELMRLRDLYGTAIVLVTHNIGVAARMADEIAVFSGGEMVEYGEREQILRHPEQEYTRQLLEAAPRLKR